VLDRFAGRGYGFVDHLVRWVQLEELGGPADVCGICPGEKKEYAKK
jgi:hypothetical protein